MASHTRSHSVRAVTVQRQRSHTVEPDRKLYSSPRGALRLDAEEDGVYRTRRGTKLPISVSLFLLSLFVPWIIHLGDMRLSIYRIVLILTLIPTLIAWIGGKAGRFRTADIALILYSVWAFISLCTLHGLHEGLQSSVILFVETTGAYLLARCYIRSAEDFYNLSLFMFKVFVCILPFAVIEAISGHNVFSELLSLVFPTPPDAIYPPRWGLRRVQAFTEHPILFGICTGSIFSLVFLVIGYGRAMVFRMSRSVIVLVLTFLSLSSGPIGAVVLQGLLIAWNALLRHHTWRWKGIILALISINLIIAANPKQSLVMFYFSNFAFDEFTAYFRVLIWRFAIGSVASHPLLGVGFGEWERPYWMPSSIDMFWLLHAVRYGLPAAFLMMLAFFSNFLTVAYKKGLNDQLSDYRTAYLLSMTGFFVAGWAVHYWNASYVLFLFFLGSGVWLSDVKQPQPSAAEPPSVEGHSRSARVRNKRPQIALRARPDHVSRNRVERPT